MRRIWWTRIDIQDLVKKFGLLVLVGVLMIPASLSFAGDHDQFVPLHRPADAGGYFP